MICDLTMSFSEREREREMELNSLNDSEQSRFLVVALADPFKRATLLNWVHNNETEEVYSWVAFWFKSYDKVENPEERSNIIDLILSV